MRFEQAGLEVESTWRSIPELRPLEGFQDAPSGEERAPLVGHRAPAIRRRTRILRRLFQLGPRAIGARLIRRGATRFERMRSSCPDLPPPLGERPGEYLAGRVGIGFFDIGERESLVAAARRLVPRDVERTLREADAILEDGLVLLGRRFRPCDEGFDWLADPQQGRVWPLRPMQESEAVRQSLADVKFVWEVNRHQFLVTLARAYAYSGDERYAERCVRAVRGWIESNPFPLGVNWSSPLEISMRL